MNRIYCALTKVSKCAIFSMLFMLSFLCFGNEVNAANTDFPYIGNDTINDADDDADDACVKEQVNDRNIGYTLISSNYGEGGSSCVSYEYDYETDDGAKIDKYFYLPMVIDSSVNSTIQFKIPLDQLDPAGTYPYDFVAVYEGSKTLGGTASYDLYSINGENITYTLVEEGAEPNNYKYWDEEGNNDINKGYFVRGELYDSFSYVLRNPQYGVNRVYLNFYDGAIDTDSITRYVEIVFYYAKPIDQFETKTVVAYNNNDCGENICIVYSNNDNEINVDNGVKTKTVGVYLPASASFYFSTINEHSATAIEENILKYNSIYAYNMFKNANTSSVKYLYYNVEDNSNYQDGTNGKINLQDNYYKLLMKIDASGEYKFSLIDVFGIANSDAELTVSDLSNRTIDVFFLRALGSSLDADVSKNNADKENDPADFFEIESDGTNLTKNNVNLVIELFYTVTIKEDYGIKVEGTIISNPLQADGTDNELNKDSTSYCKLYFDGDEATCVEEISQFTSHTFNAKQTVNATYDVLDVGRVDNSIGKIENAFEFSQGTVDVSDVAESVTGVHNKTNIWVNENGRYSFTVTDIYENSTVVTIDVSIIDQLQPTLTGEAANICTSSYVVGGNGSSVYEGYPYVNACDARTVEYDIAQGEWDSVGNLGDMTAYSLAGEEYTIYYNESGARSFDYLDAIIMSSVIAKDQISYISKAEEKYIENAKTRSEYFYDKELKSTVLNTLISEANEAIVKGNYIQYSSGLTTFADIHDGNQLLMTIRVNGEELEQCNLDNNQEACYAIINNYIDRGMSFEIYFKAIDAVGNESNTLVVKINVVDDTAPGIIDVNPETGEIVKEKPDIQMVNINTKCRLEIGNTIQTKEDLLDCYGFRYKISEGAYRYTFADNKSGYLGYDETENKETFIDSEHANFSNILSYQRYNRYESYLNNINVYVEINENWISIGDDRTASNLKMENAGYYKLRFEITDAKDVDGDTLVNEQNNTTIITVWYYVNPRLLLIAPKAQTIEYGTLASTLGYDVYITADDTLFYTNLFGLSPVEQQQMLANYHTSTDYLVLSDRVMAGELGLVYSGSHKGMSYTTSTHKINQEATLNSGSYYITLGDIKVNNVEDENNVKEDKENYIIRLHPAYLINGVKPKETLASYDEEDVQENVSSVYFIVKQIILDINANGGSKIYGVLDTNYTYYNVTDFETNKSNYAYLNGYTASGFVTITGANERVLIDDTDKSLIDGVLRREAGEAVGTYAICNSNARDANGLKSPNDLTFDSCYYDGEFTYISAFDAIKIENLTAADVYYFDGSEYKNPDIINKDELSGYYVKIVEEYYKIRHDMIQEDNGNKVIIVPNIESWSYGYDDQYDALQIIANDVTGNKNYVIDYTFANYTIDARNIVVQPGINQGKEYSNPSKLDPIWQIVIYGEIDTKIDIQEDGFNGYTTTVNEGYLSLSDPTVGTYDGDTEVYFNRRKKTPAAGVYNYEYIVSMDGNGVFTLDGVEYKMISESKICRNTGNNSELECYTADGNGKFTIGGINVVDKKSSNEIRVTITGNLQYQNYTLFKSNSENAKPGSGIIARADGETVGWYEFYTTQDDGLDLALVTDNYTYTYTVNAPSHSDGVYTTQETQGADYAPNGSDVCSSDFYSSPCTPGTTMIMFEIFKRDVIISFNYQQDYYAYALVDYKTWYLLFESTNNEIPQNSKGINMITCYMLASEASDLTNKIIYTVDEKQYVVSDACSGDHGIAEDDSWGVDGLNLTFSLALEESELFYKDNQTVYALPAGLHYVHASATNDNYRLVYLDYYAVQGGEAENGNKDESGNGALNILSSKVTINATMYKKEYGKAIYNSYHDGDSWQDAAFNIFDLNFIGNENENGIGGGIDSNNSFIFNTDAVAYNSHANIYGYVVTPVIETDETGVVKQEYYFAGTQTIKGSIHGDTIYNNFYGVPVRDEYTGHNSDDKYGALDGVGLYSISLNSVSAAYATYGDDDAGLFGVEVSETSLDSTSMITRYTNYEIVEKKDGSLYITPVEITIEVVENQTKIYGCAYTSPTEDKDTGVYSDCSSAVGDYADFGYVYNVYGDRTYELMNGEKEKLTTYINAAGDLIENTMAAYGGVDDYEYDPEDAYTVVGKVTESSSALNDGVLYRAKKNQDNKYKYKTYFDYANAALTTQDGKYVGFQDQSVGEYVLTLGNLDAKFNGNNTCNTSSEVSNSETYECKNFYLTKGASNTTASHTRESGDTTTRGYVSEEEVIHEYADTEFTITARTVELFTEYNYKIYGDTEPNEGFTCAQIAAMYTYAADTNRYNSGVAFSFQGRSVCASDDTFVNMGIARYYAVENTLARAPWTKWSDGKQGSETPSEYYLYDDILWDVVKGEIDREKTSDPTNDPVGQYEYDWVNVGLTDDRKDDYTIKRSVDGEGKYIGWYVEDDSSMARWYGDDKHVVHSETNADNQGYKDYSFIINKELGNFPFNTNNGKKEFGPIYFEIVKREIILVVDEVEKDYGIEDTFALFTVKLCSTYDTSTRECMLIEDANGIKNTLSIKDYGAYITNGSYDDQAIKGFTGTTGTGRFIGDNTANGATTRGSFGIYFARVNGEAVGEYIVKACPRQADDLSECTTDNGTTFDAGEDGKNYNAANYIITSYTGKLTINQREIKITPDSNQGFQYGNYESGEKIAPITYKETYKDGSAIALNNGVNGYTSANTHHDLVNGLVNGAIGYTSAGAAIDDDSLSNQYGLCLFNISGKHMTCINDRQNSVVDEDYIAKAYTAQYSGNAIHNQNGVGVSWVVGNVYNDGYDEDGDTSRNALDRKINDEDGHRYNRNVGTYTITLGDLASANNTNLNSNYYVNGFNDGYDSVKYIITPAVLTVIPKSGQSKIYGEQDKEISFSVITRFKVDSIPVDTYYCNSNEDCNKYSEWLNTEQIIKVDEYIEMYGFAYGENGSDHNYGQARDSVKSSAYARIQSSVNGLRYYDKYCYLYETKYSDSTCTGGTITYKGEEDDAVTGRILLGYLYVYDVDVNGDQSWAQKAGEHNIVSGMAVAINEHGEKNYNLTYNGVYMVNVEEPEDEEIMPVDEEDLITFTIHKLELDVSIVDIIKTYGEATDKYKCDDGDCYIRENLLNAEDNQDRLEFNFNVYNHDNEYSSGKNMDDNNKVLLTKGYNGFFYTQTGNAEYKNEHLGLTVVRAISSEGACLYEGDAFGCEDVGTYTLSFLYTPTGNGVEDNYLLYIKVGEDTRTLDKTGVIDENYSYLGITQGETKDEARIEFEETEKYVKDYDSATLTINQRKIEFYIGTYTQQGLIDETYTIEQNESLPDMPKLNNGVTTAITNPKSKQVYYVTWYDSEDETTVRSVRLGDILTTSIKNANGDTDEFGIAYCKKSIQTLNLTDVNDVSVDECDGLFYSKDQNAQDGNEFKFDTSRVGTYAILRDEKTTGISPTSAMQEGYEQHNYDTTKTNGTLVIFEDSTAPIIEIPDDIKYAIEANAEVICDGGVFELVNGKQECVGEGAQIKIVGKQVPINEDVWELDNVGNAIKYLAQYFSNFNIENGQTTNNMIDRLQIKAGGSVEENSSKFNGYCFAYETTEICSSGNGNHLFYVVNNPEFESTLVKDTTTRASKTYNWDGNVINDHQTAITTILSWFGVTSYDYSYIRNKQYVAKRYTPRYYIFINGNADTEGKFNPMYVGDYTISIYAMDDVGNISEPITATLSIKDETKPVSGEVHVFNLPVKCNSNNIVACNSGVEEWLVDIKENQNLVVHLNNFVKYSYDNGYVIDDVNGTYIKINGGYKNIYSELDRTDKDGNPDIAGKYIVLTSADIVAAMEVEHRYWRNNDTVYTIILGGSDNSYIDLTDSNDKTQWNHYYRIEDNWYQYSRLSKESVVITTREGVGNIVISALDSGRKFNEATIEHKYYKAIYLIYQGAPNDQLPTGAKDAAIDAEISTQGTAINDGSFNILGVKYTLSEDNTQVTWGVNGIAIIEDYKFQGNMVVCEFERDFSKVTTCATTYKGVYKEGDLVSINVTNYVLDEGDNYNLSDFDSSEEQDYYRDRKYIFIDKTGGIATINGQGYKIYEFGCDDNCGNSHSEEYITVKDINGEAGGRLSVSGTSVDDSYKEKLNANVSSGNIVIKHPGVTNIDDVKNSGVAVFDNSTTPITYTDVMSGSTGDETLINYFYTNVRIYLSIDVDHSNTWSFYKYTIVWDGSEFVVYRSKKLDEAYSKDPDVVTSLTEDEIKSKTTIEDVINLIVSSDKLLKDNQESNDTEYQFNIDYSIYDIAGNESTTVVRGVTYIKLSSKIKITIDNKDTGENVLVDEGNNTYSLTINQGVSLGELIGNLNVTNIGRDGVNNLSSIRQTLYYNGDALFEDMIYNEDIMSLIDEYASVPGTYTLKLSSKRNVESQGQQYEIEDMPLIINFIIQPVHADLEDNSIDTQFLVTILALTISSMFLIGIGYVVVKKSKKN